MKNTIRIPNATKGGIWNVVRRVYSMQVIRARKQEEVERRVYLGTYYQP